ncbi:MAG TPA: hypothetical protein VMS38_31385 [Pseudorhodoferax sp.]|nr:hypothetical protein [Pseudorhodoferax sp.]
MADNTYTLAKPITLPNGAILGKVEIRPIKGAHLAKIGDDIKTVTVHFLKAAEASKRGDLPEVGGSAEYMAMLSIVRELTSLGEDAPEIDAGDLNGLVSAVLFETTADLGNS